MTNEIDCQNKRDKKESRELVAKGDVSILNKNADIRSIIHIVWKLQVIQDFRRTSASCL